MTDPTRTPPAGGFERQLRDMNEALLVSAVRHHELTEKAQRAEAIAAGEIAERKRAESLIQCQKEALELVVKGEPIERVLDFLARSMESQSQSKFVAAIHLMESDGHHFGYVAAPSLPARYAQATRGMDARLELGACSSAVVSHKQTIIRDFAVETRWPGFTAEMLSLGLRGCFTTPIVSLSPEPRTLGTFALYYREPGDPSPHDQQLVDLVTHTVALAIDRKQVEQALRESEERFRTLADQLANESRRKDEFLAMLSHELRNPLAPIRSAVHILKLHQRGSEDAIQQQTREIIERQVGNLTKLVGDLLEVSRVISGRIQLDLTTLDLNQVVEHAVETVTPLIEQHKHELVMYRCSEPIWVHADATRMEEVLINLLNNAAKYTPDGGRIDVWCEGIPGDKFIQVRVRDSGVGIDEKLLPRIFDLFTQADRSLAHSAGGLGIGLSLAHRLVELHGGTLEVHSPPRGSDVGSEFIVELARAAAPFSATQVQPDEPAPNPSGIRVLVVDDNIDLVMMLSTALRDKGYAVWSAYTGPEALELARQSRPDVVLLDIGLPGLDGYEVARQLRSMPIEGTGDGKTFQVRLIAVTGYGQESDITRARDAGFDAHVVKPYDIDALEKLMTSKRK